MTFLHQLKVSKDRNGAVHFNIVWKDLQPQEVTIKLPTKIYKIIFYAFSKASNLESPCSHYLFRLLQEFQFHSTITSLR